MKKKKIQKKNTTDRRALFAIAKTASPDNRKIYFALAIILLISFLVYLPVLQNSFVWDDGKYIQDNPLLVTFNLKDIFSQYVLGNYHPLTILTLAIEYKFFGLNATGYHVVNLLLHLLNTVLVFYAVFQLSEKYGVALIAALLFGVHPLHVESVAWASELKDLLYTFFFLASYIFYLQYLKDLQKKYIFIALLLFLLSLLSKAMAASLPVVLILTDYFKGRKINLRSLLEKIPFFSLAIILGIIAVFAQKSEGATDAILFPFYQQVIFSSYGFIMYLVKLILPLDLSAYYPYPIKNGEIFPSQYYIYLFLFMVLLAFLFYSLRYSRKLFFGIGFFSVTVFLVLQLFPVGGAIMADRYSYIPSIGIFYLVAESIYYLWQRKIKLVPIFLLCSLTVFFSVKSYARCATWKNSMTLWSDVISKYQTVLMAYINRGGVFMDETKYTEALADFNKAIEIDSSHFKANYNRGLSLMNLQRNSEALNDFNKAIKLNSTFPEAFINRGILLQNQNKYSEALDDFNKAIELQPDFSIAYFNRGTLYMNQTRNEEALKDFYKSIELNPVYFQAYHNIGNIFTNEKKYGEAITNYSKAIELKADYSISYYSRGLAAYNSGKKDAACADMKKAENLGYQPATAFLNQVCK